MKTKSDEYGVNVSIRLKRAELSELDSLADMLAGTRTSAIRYAVREVMRAKEKSGAVLVDAPAGAAPRVSLQA